MKMAHILFAWELGADLGHLNRMLPIARLLQARGHTVFMVVRDLSKIQQLIRHDDKLLWFQAPLWLPRLNGGKQFSYAELLLSSGGFLGAEGLMGLVRAWHTLFATIQPDLLVADHAPVSLLASRALPFKKMLLGTGFCIPPALSPIPPFRTWESCEDSRIRASERLALGNANSVLAVLGRPALHQLHDLFAVDATFLTVWPELDHYQQRVGQPVTYTGPITVVGAGALPVWPDAQGKKLFVYLKAGYPMLEAVLAGLGRSGMCVLAYIAGVARQQLAVYATPSLAFSNRPLVLDRVLQEADAVLCHGGMGTVSQALQAGKPVLVLPMQGEQRVTGERVSALGYGLWLEQDHVPDRLGTCLTQIMQDTAMFGRVEAFSAKYADISAGAAINMVVAKCAALLDSR